MNKHILLFLMTLQSFLCGCMRWDYGDLTTDFDNTEPGLFIVCEGNFQYGNATLSFYNPSSLVVENEIFYKANGMKLGDVAQSMTIYNNMGWIVVNNSHVVFAIDIDTYREKGRIENLTSPRYIHFISEQKAYVSQLWDNRIFIVNPKTYSVTGFITVPDMVAGYGSTEQMVQVDQYVYCNCWSYQNKIIKIDTETDEVVASLTVGIQPKSMVIDRQGYLWTLTDGGYEGSPYGYELPALHCIDLESFTVSKSFHFSLGDAPTGLCINSQGDTLYWINDDVWRMDIDADQLPLFPVISSINTKYYALTVDPDNSQIYVADAIDYMQPGIIYRYSTDGILMEQFYSGVTPGFFCWK